MSYVSIAGLDKAEVLAALFNGSRQLGMGFLHSEGRALMSIADAREVLKSGQDFDYLRGRVMKIGMGEEPMYVGLYDRDNGPGAAERIINGLRRSPETEAPRERSSTLEPQAAWPFPLTSNDYSGDSQAAPAPEPERAPAFAAGGGGDFGGGGADASYADSSSSSDSGSSDSSSSSSSD